MITDQDIAAADQAAAEAEAQRAAAQREVAAQNYGPEVAQRLAGATWRANHAAAQATRLRALKAEQEAAIAARADAERAAEPRLRKMASTLAGTRDAAVKAIQDAEAALVRMLEATTAHERAVRDTATELRRRGLPTDDVAGEHETGGDVDGSVRLAGEQWVPLDPAPLFAGSVAAAAAAVWGERTAVGGWAKSFPGMHTATRINTGQLVGRITSPEPAAIQRVDVGPPREPVEGAPVVWRSDFERDQEVRRIQAEAKHNALAHEDLDRIAARIDKARAERIKAAAADGPAAA